MTLAGLISWFLRRWAWVAVATSLSMLAIAHGFERFGNMPPCALCLRQREAYWMAAGIGAVALLVARFRPDAMTQRALLALMGLAFGAGAAIAAFHVGVEYKWWPGLPECSGGGAGTFAPGTDLLSALSKPMKVARCDEPAWSLLGLSMAGWNMLIALKMALYSFLAMARPQGFKGHEHD